MSIPSYEVVEADCVEYMKSMEPCSIDSIVTDPPYGLGFMGKKWDSLPPGDDFAKAALNVLKPGGHLLAFGGTRTSHRLVCAIEDAGFEIRDTISWFYGTGFPKALNVSKAIDKAVGVEREVLGPNPNGRNVEPLRYGGDNARPNLANNPPVLTAPATPEAKQWDGWHTALKPAHEPIVVARKPLIGTVAVNVLEHGTGALNIDATRIETDDKLGGGAYSEGARTRDDGWVVQRPGDENAMRNGGAGDFEQPTGRWPANVVLDEEAAVLLDEQTGTLTSGKEVAGGHRRNQDADRNVYGSFEGQEAAGALYGDSGGASRFFYTAKASRSEREAGLDGANKHATVKPIDLMRWLVRLVTPPDGKILDPFVGSGTTGIAAIMEGFDFIGIEQESEYVKIAEARMAHWAAKKFLEVV